MDVNSKTIMVHVAILEQKKMPVHSKTQAQVKALLFDEAFIEVLVEYSDYSNVFLAENVTELPENTGMNKHTIKLKEDKQSLF